MGRISNIMENGIAGLVGTLEFRQPAPDKRSQPSPAGNIGVEKRVGFTSFIFREKKNRNYLLIALVGTIIQFVVFKMLYPFPDFISDSYSYIATNTYHMDVNLWPIGYSKFLLLVHMINHSDILLVGIQYFLLEGSLAYFFFSVLYLYRPAKGATMVIYVFLFFNPLFLYLGNAVLSDSLFAALSISFITQFLWTLHRPKISQVAIQGVIIGICFTIRYTAIYYPLIALIGLLLSRHRPKMKAFGFLLGVGLMIPFYLYTAQKTKVVTGTAQFSVFGGWQIANNALYMYGHINVDSNSLPPDIRSLDRMSKQFFKVANPSTQELFALPGTYFIKVPFAILKPYMSIRFSSTTPPDQFKAWGKVSPIYNKYGNYLIRHFPLAFAKYYLLYNTKNYFLPHLEKFQSYNLGIGTVPSVVQDWFDYISPNVYSVSSEFQGKLFYLYPILFMALNLFFLSSVMWTLFVKKWKKTDLYLRRTIILTTTFIIVNFSFSVFATPVVLRYQIVPMILLLSISLLLLENTNKIAS